MDEGKLGRLPTTPEFPALTPEDLKEIYELFIRLFANFPWKEFPKGEAPGFRAFTGINASVGEWADKYNPRYNSAITWWQLLYVLAMTRHSLVKELAKSGYDNSKFDAKILVDAKIMEGMKILDLGSGPFPVFARCCRAMGADVWTVDKSDKNYRYGDFRDNRKNLSPEQAKIEDEQHIDIDLTNSNATEFIMQKSKGNFNLATEANLNADGVEQGKEISMALLKIGGVWNCVKESPELKE